VTRLEFVAYHDENAFGGTDDCFFEGNQQVFGE
jgi:hypothetical protein